MFSGNSMAQSFSYADFNSLSGSIDVGAAAYWADLNFTSGAYLPGALTTVPLPTAIWLFGSGMLGLVGIAWRKKA